MAYHKRPATTRTCVHCDESYQAVDRRRLYCSSSCKVQACKAKRRRRLAAKNSALGAVPLVPNKPTTPDTPIPQTLAWNAQNIAVLGTAAALGNLGVKVGERVVESFKQPPLPVLPPAPPAQLVNPLSWLPPGLLTANAPRVPLDVPSLGKSVVFVVLEYLGHTLYYQPSQRLLLWRAEPGKLLTLHSPQDVALVAERIPHDDYAASWTRPLGTGAILKDLG